MIFNVRFNYITVRIITIALLIQIQFVKIIYAQPIAFCISSQGVCIKSDKYNKDDLNHTCFLGNEEALARCKRALQSGLSWDNKAYKFTNAGNGMTGSEAGKYYHDQINKKEKQKKVQDYVTVGGGVVAAAGLAMTVGAAIGVKNDDRLKGALIGSGVGMMVGGGVTAYVANRRSQDTARELRSLRFAQEDNVENMVNTEYVQNQLSSNTYSGYNKGINKYTVTGLNGRQYFKSSNGDIDLGGNTDNGKIQPGEGNITGPIKDVDKPCSGAGCKECYSSSYNGDGRNPQCGKQGLDAYSNCRKTTYNSYISNGLGNLTHILKDPGKVSIYGPGSSEECCKQAAKINKKDFSAYQGYDQEKGCLWKNSGGPGEGGKEVDIGWDVINGSCVECINGKTGAGVNCKNTFKSKEECLNKINSFVEYSIDYWGYDKDGNCIHYDDVLKLPYNSTEEDKRNAKLKLFREKNYFETQAECLDFYRKSDKWVCCKKTARVPGFVTSNKSSFYLINYCNTLVSDCSGRVECHYDKLSDYDPTTVETVGESQCSGASKYSEASALRDLKISIARFR